MARQGIPVQVYLTETLRNELLSLCGETGRSLSDELRRAAERHLASRPKVVEPPLAEEVVSLAGDAAAPKKRGRKPKA